MIKCTHCHKKRGQRLKYGTKRKSVKDIFIKEEAHQRQQPVTKVFPNDDDVAQFLKEEAHLGSYE